MNGTRRLHRTLLGALLAVTIGGCGPLGSSAPMTPGPDGSPIVVGGSPLLGKPAPPIELADLAGGTVSLAEYAGRPVVVNFWASWCVPCRDEFPVFVAGRETYAEQGLEILGVIYKDNAESARTFAEDQGALWPLLQNGAQVFVCGDGRHMAPAVREALIDIYEAKAGGTRETASQWLEDLIDAGRYHQDVYGFGK